MATEMADFSAFSTGPAIGAIVAAAVTAAFASLKFYSDKAAKVTDFRQDWIESLRNDVAEFSGSTHTIAGRIAIRSRHGDFAARAGGESQAKTLISIIGLLVSTKPTINSTFDKEFETELLAHWSTLRMSYNKIILHLNPVEHLAYIRAEEAIAAYTKDKNESTVIRKDVENFLWKCIQLAERNSTTQAMKEHKHNALDSIYHAATGANRGSVISTRFLTGYADIEKLCAGAGSCLLLAVFATRQLLHGSYSDVLKNIPRIEHGIRVIDTSAAIVIKNVWEDIKRGEPSYRNISKTALISALLLFAVLGAVIYFSPEKHEKNLITSCDWLWSPHAPQAATMSLSKTRVICKTISAP